MLTRVASPPCSLAHDPGAEFLYCHSDPGYTLSTLTHRNNIIYSYIMSLKKIIYKTIINKEKKLVLVQIPN